MLIQGVTSIARRSSFFPSTKSQYLRNEFFTLAQMLYEPRLFEIFVRTKY